MTEKFSETERFEEFVDNLNRKGFQIPEAELAVQSIYDEGFEAGRIAEHKDVLERALNFSLPEIKEKLEQIQEQARKEVFEKVGNLWELHYGHVFKGGGGNSLQCMTRFNEELEALKKKEKE
jgi:hypothetical protein